MINGETRLFGIIGNPVRHSLSPEMHNAAFRELGINCVYVPLPVKNVSAGAAGLKALGFEGVSVTIPHKQDIISFTDELDPVAAKIGAVNTLVIKQNAGSSGTKIYGYNTDWIGANRALEEKISLQGTRVLIIGAGGSARALGFGFLEAGAGVILSNRTAAKGEKLADQLGCSFYGLSDIEQVDADILVNATSVGMTPNPDRSPVSADLLPRFKVVMDIVYAPLQTRLLQEAAEAGCKTVDGLAMLLYQGVAQFELWTGKDAPVNVMRDVLYRRFK